MSVKSGYKVVSVWHSLEGLIKDQEKCLPPVVSTVEFHEWAFSGSPNKLTIHARKAVCFLRVEVQKGFLYLVYMSMRACLGLLLNTGVSVYVCLCVCERARVLKFYSLPSLACYVCKKYGCLLCSEITLLSFIFNISLLNHFFLEFLKNCWQSYLYFFLKVRILLFYVLWAILNLKVQPL